MSNNKVEVTVDNEFFDPEDPDKNIFTYPGLFNYIIRYGGGFMADKIETGIFSKEQTAFNKNNNFKNIRKFVLENADSGSLAAKTLEKFYNFRTRTSPVKTNRRERTAQIRKSLKCPLYYKVTPNIEIFIGSEKIADNKSVSPLIHNEIVIQVKNISIQVSNEKEVKAGTIPVYQGTITVDYYSPNKSKKNDVLAEIARNKDKLGYLFKQEEPYLVKIYNTPKDILALPDDKEACDELLKQRIILECTTLKHELIEWKPFENTATFEITFVKSINPLDRVEGPAPDGIPVISSGGQLLGAASLLDAIERSLVEANSLFRYKVYRSQSLTTLVVSNQQAQPIAEAEFISPLGGARATRQTGQFFLFRSLLVAVLNTFYEGTTRLNKKTFEDSLFKKEVYDALNIFIDEEQTPNESGYDWTSTTETGFKHTYDIRNTLETLVIDFGDFITFLNTVAQKNQKITFNFIIGEIFNNLLPTVLKKFVKQGVDDKYCNMFDGEGSTDFFQGIDFSKVDFGGRYNIRYLDFDSSILKTPKPEIERYIWTGAQAGGLKKISEKLEAFGKTKINYVNIDQLLTGVNHTNIDDEKNKDRVAIVIQKGITDNTTQYQLAIDTTRVGKGDATKLEQELLDEGLINMVWFKKDDPDENLRNRIIASYGTNPFSFSSVENKNLDTAARMEGGTKDITRRVFDTSFSVSDVLLLEPYLSKFYFNPSFFGFSTEEEDIFGYSGRYFCKSVSISYDQAQGRFVSQVEAERILVIEPERNKTDRQLASETDEAKEIYQLGVEISSLRLELERLKLNEAGNQLLIVQKETELEQLLGQYQAAERIQEERNKEKNKKDNEIKTAVEAVEATNNLGAGSVELLI